MGTHGVESGMKGTSNQERKESRDDRRYKNLDGVYYSEEHEYFQEEVDQWLGKMNATERNGVEEYTGHYYETMNEYLREGKMGSGDNPSIESRILRCEKGLDKYKLGKNIMIYRRSTDDLLSSCLHDANGVAPRYTYGMTAHDYVNLIKNYIGSKVHDDGFTSASTQHDTWAGKVQYNIKVPKGTNGAYVDHISWNHGEREFLLNRGTHFRITGAHVEGHQAVVDLVVIKK